MSDSQIASPAPDAAAAQGFAPSAAPSAVSPPTPKQQNTISLTGFIVAVVGFVFACIPGALIVGWVLLPIGFILSIVGLCLSGKKKGLSIAGLILSIVGTIVGFVVFFAVLATSIDDALSGGEITIEEPAAAEGSEAEPAEQEDAAPSEGTRDNPFPIGTVISQGDWTLTVNSVNLDATALIAEMNQFNEPAPAGQVYILVNITSAYTGTDAEGELATPSVEFVTSSGNTVLSSDTFVVTPDQFDTLSTEYEGASVSGNIALAVPTEGLTDGTLAVRPHMLGDKVFVAVK